jgi:hypothetical protein
VQSLNLNQKLVNISMINGSFVDPDPSGWHNFDGFGYVFFSTKCKAELYRTVLFPKKFKILSKILKIMTHDAVEKDKTSVTQFFKAFLSQKNLIELPEIWVGDPGSGNRAKTPISDPDPVVKRHRIPDLAPQHLSSGYISPDRSNIPHLRGERLESVYRQARVVALLGRIHRIQQFTHLGERDVSYRTDHNRIKKNKEDTYFLNIKPYRFVKAE